MGWARKNIFELNQKQKRIELLCAPGLLSISLLRNVQACTEQTGTVAALQGQGGDGGVRGWGGEGGGIQLHLRPCQEAKQLKTNNVGGKDMLHENRELGEIRVSL